jgi:hypothetical protein
MEKFYVDTLGYAQVLAGYECSICRKMHCKTDSSAVYIACLVLKRI